MSKAEIEDFEWFRLLEAVERLEAKLVALTEELAELRKKDSDHG